MMGTVTFRAFRAEDALAIVLQPSQLVEAGIDASEMTEAGARDLATRGAAWTALGADGRILCCAGLREVFAGKHAVAWSMLSTALGVRQHLAITRFARARIAESSLVRIETMTADDSRCRKWAVAVGLEFKTDLECWGIDSETVLLFQRIKPCRH